MTVTGQKKISIYDPATGTVVQLNNISEEGEFEKKGAFIKTSAGSRMYSGDESKAEFLSLDWTGYDQLVTWMKERTPVRFVTYGLDEHILWYEDTLITVDLKTVFSPYKRSGFKIYFEKAGGVHGIYKGCNILYAVLGYSDGNSDNKADGYTIATDGGSFSFLFENAAQKIICNSNGQINSFSYSLIYPIAGCNFFLKQNKGMNDNFSYSHHCISYSFSETVLSQDITSSNVTLNHVTSSNIYKIQVRLIVYNTNAIAGNVAHIGSPNLSTSSGTGIVNY